ncbi:MAG: chorismate mutase [Candidatus Moranbacteria bacterium]|nr:chorismate mutase [Candidatus Moranbacteria bacterium]
MNEKHSMDSPCSQEKPASLDSLREQIDILDRELVRILAERSRLIPKVVEAKLEQNLPIFQPEREAQQYEKFSTIAAEFGIDPLLVQKIFELVIEQSKDVQNRILAEKGIVSSSESRTTDME